MGTNFYATTQDGTEYHLGKRSYGWTFLFRATEHFATARELVGWLETTPVTIRDEYGQEHSPVAWYQMATTWGTMHDRPHRQTGCWCGPDRGIHGRPWPRIEALEYIDADNDTDWSRSEFS